MEWTGARYADNPVVEVQTWIDSLPEPVWRLVSDIELMPTMSTELRAVQMAPARSGLSFAIDEMPDREQKIVFVRLREFERGMTDNLAQIKALAEGGR